MKYYSFQFYAELLFFSILCSIIIDSSQFRSSLIPGYVDDPRNTDNAWMETVAVNFHDETGASVGRFPLSAGDDAGAVAWVDIHSNLMLYASHSEFIQQVALEKNAHWS
jgi:ADP-ribose pyrophosphatase